MRQKKGDSNMKLITLNTHSLIEEHYEEKLHAFAEMVRKEKPDILALQEVNQTQSLCRKSGRMRSCRDLCAVVAFVLRCAERTIMREGLQSF